MGDVIVSDQEGKAGFDLSKIDEVINSHKYTRRTVLKGAAAAGALAAVGPVLSACGSSGSSSSSSPSAAAGPKKGGHIRSGVGGGSAKDTLDAHLPTSEVQIGTQWQMYDALLGWDQTHKLVMLLAESYTPNSDGTQHTVKLKSGLTFHNGKAVTADDVVYSFQRILNPKTAAIGSSTLVGLKASGIKKVDNLTVTFVLDQPNVIFYEALAYYPNAIVPVGYDPKGMTGAIGTGPWKVTGFQPGQQTEFAANTSYWGTGPYADQLTMIEFADPTAKLNALLGGTVDHITLLESAQASVIQSNPAMQLLQAKSGGWDPFTMRIDQKPFNDVRVRQAFRLIVDRPQMIAQAKGGYAWVGNDMYAPFDPGYPKDVPQRVQDIAQAKSLLKAAGYGNGLTVQLTTSTAVGAADVAAAQVFAQQAKAAGVTVNVNKVDPSVFYGNDYLKWTFAQDFWATRNYLPQVQNGTAPNAPFNETHWKDPQWQALINQAFKTVDVTKRNELVSEASKIEYQRGGNIVWSFNISLDAHSKKLQGVLEDNWGANSACRCRYNLMYFA
jgi:peptide/nickel transport system substrate-binding protein